MKRLAVLHCILSIGTAVYLSLGPVSGSAAAMSAVQPAPTSSLDATQSVTSRAHAQSVRTASHGTVWAWGRNHSGQLGDGTTNNRALPGQVNSLTNMIAIAADDNHSLAVNGDGTVWAWGRNQFGQLGDGTTDTPRTSPVQVSGLTGAVAVAAGWAHSLALKSDGTVWAWGYNGDGRLGDGTTTTHALPVQVNGPTGVVAIAAGDYHSLALKSDGTVWAWGDNGAGQLGDGTRTNHAVPAQVSGLTDVVAIATRDYHNLAVKGDGTVWAWGQNYFGQLGDGTTTASDCWCKTSPVQVSGLRDVVSAAAGHQHSVAVKGDGTVWTWGYNAYGQLGDGTTTHRALPAQISGLTDVVAITAGLQHSVAVKSDGTVWAWGYNGDGQLGNGATTCRAVPGQVSSLTGVTRVDAGWHTLALVTAPATAPMPHVGFTPSSVAAGSRIELSGGGFASTGTVTASLVDSANSANTYALTGSAPLKAGGFTDTSFTVPATVPSGNYYVRATDGTHAGTSSGTLAVTAPPNPGRPRGNLDAPADGATVSGTSLTVSGWAIDEAATSGTGVDRVQVYLDGVHHGDAIYGAARSDVAAYLGSANYTNSGYTYTLGLRGLAPGSHTVQVKARSAVSGAETAYPATPRSMTVPAPSSPAGNLDAPAAGSTVSGASVTVRGWAVDKGATSGTGVDRVQVYLDGVYTGTATYGLSRPDVATVFGSANYTNSGYSFTLNLAGVSHGSHSIQVKARSTQTGEETTYSRTVTVNLSDPRGNVDAPAAAATVSGASVNVRGWALDKGASTGTGVDRVQIYVDGVYKGDATYGAARSDVGNVHGAQFSNSGYSYTLSLSDLAPGSHTLQVKARSTVTGAETAYPSSPRSITVPMLSSPAGNLDAPAPGHTVSGASVDVRGWAVDKGAASSTGVDRVQVYLDGVYQGDATYGAARPDVASYLGSPNYTNSGYSYTLSLNGLAPGTHTIHVKARSTVSGTDTSYPATPRSITVP